MIGAAFPWGWFSDHFGRRLPLIIGFVGMVAGLVAAGLSPNFWTFFICMIAIGAFVIGPISLILTYAAELHSQKYRPIILMWMGLFSAIATILQALLAMAVIPIEMPSWAPASWRTFLFACTVPSILSALILLFLPDSPRFLLSKGKTTEALRVLQRVYAANTGKEADQFPVKSLLSRPVKAGEGKKSALAQLVPLFRTPHLVNAVYTLSLQFLVLSCQNAVRMWMPQMFAQINDYAEHQAAGVIPADAPMGTCYILDYTHAETAVVNATQDASSAIFQCHQRIVPAKVYLNSVIIGAGLAVSHFITGLLASRISPRVIFVCGAMCAVASALALQAVSSSLAPFLAAALQAALSNTSSAGMAACVDLFPTSIRSSAVSLTNMFGRIGSLVGNIVFPMLLNTTCSTAFYAVAGVITVSCLVGFSLPVPSKTRNVSVVDMGNSESKVERKISVMTHPNIRRMRATSFDGIPLTIVSLDSVNMFLPDDENTTEDEVSRQDVEATISAGSSLATVSSLVDKEERPVTTSNQTLHM